MYKKVRTSTAYALGTFIHSGGKTERNELANKIDHAVALQLVNVENSEASPLVHKEVKKLLSLEKLRIPLMFYSFIDCRRSAVDCFDIRIHFHSNGNSTDRRGKE